MVKLAWKIINGYGPYAYLQKSVKHPGGKVVSEHIKYLGSLSNPKVDFTNLVPGTTFTYQGEVIKVIELPKAQFLQLKPGPAHKYVQKAGAGGTKELAAELLKDGQALSVAKQKLAPQPKAPAETPPGHLTPEQWQAHKAFIEAKIPVRLKDKTDDILTAAKLYIGTGDAKPLLTVTSKGIMEHPDDVSAIYKEAKEAKVKSDKAKASFESGMAGPITGKLGRPVPAGKAPTVAPKSKPAGKTYSVPGIPGVNVHPHVAELPDGVLGNFNQAMWHSHLRLLKKRGVSDGDFPVLAINLYKAIEAGSLKPVANYLAVAPQDPPVNKKVEEIFNAGWGGSIPQTLEQYAKPGKKFDSSGDDSAQSEMVADVADGKVKMPKQSIPSAKTVNTQATALSTGKKDWDADLQKISGQKGSNAGGLFKDKKLQTFHYVKWPGEDRARVEVLAGMMYRMAGVPVPETRFATVDGKPAVISDWIENAQPMTAAEMKADKNVRNHFVADAWLANWDVVGLKHDNIVKAPGGTAVRIDPGGALVFRAQGAKKDYPASVVNELQAMRDPQVAHQAGPVFEDLKTAELKAGVKRITKISDIQIDESVDSLFPAANPLNKQLKTALKGRRDYLQKTVVKGKVAPKSPPFAAIAKTAKLPKELIETGAYTLAQGNGNNEIRRLYLNGVAKSAEDLGPARVTAAQKATSLFITWKGHTSNDDSNLLRWAAQEAQGKKGALARRNMQRFWKYKKFSKDYGAILDKRIATEGEAAVRGIKVHQRANLPVTALRFHNTDKVLPGKKITVYRYFKPDQAEFLGWKGAQIGDKLKMNNTDIYSYSFSSQVAKNFASGHGAIGVKAEIPMKNILITDRVSNTASKHAGEDEVLWIQNPVELEVFGTL